MIGNEQNLPTVARAGREGTQSGGLVDRLIELAQLTYDEDKLPTVPIIVDPGDFYTINEGDVSGIALTLPIAFDVWYLWVTKNILPEDEDSRKVFEEIVLTDFLKANGDVSVLRTVRKKDLEPVQGDRTQNSYVPIPDLSFFQTNGISNINEMRFETFLKDRSPKYPSKGSKKVNEDGRDKVSVGNEYCSYLAIPVGSMGVMEQIAFTCQSYLDLQDKEKKTYDGTYKAVKGDSFFPPEESESVNCKGLLLVEKAYKQTILDIEYPAEKMPDYPSILPHQWLRLWLNKELKYPIPGEFCGITVKPLVAPPHVWWFQPSTPLLYSGNWFETDYYTSGTVLVVFKTSEPGKMTVDAINPDLLQRQSRYDTVFTLNQEVELDSLTQVYKVRVKEHDIYLKPTDFHEYKIGDKVAIVKQVCLNKDNFNWNKLEQGKTIPDNTVEGLQKYDKYMSDKPFELNSKWVIAPITFYEGD